MRPLLARRASLLPKFGLSGLQMLRERLGRLLCAWSRGFEPRVDNAIAKIAPRIPRFFMLFFRLINERLRARPRLA